MAPARDTAQAPGTSPAADTASVGTTSADTTSADTTSAGPALLVPRVGHGAGLHLPFAARRCDAHPHTLRLVRDFTRVTLDGWGHGRLVGDVTTIVSELVSNALRHALPGPGPDTADGGAVRASDAAWLSLAVLDDVVLCVVSDPRGEPPTVSTPDDGGDGAPDDGGDGAPDEGAERGRGLRVVGALSRAWGWAPDRPGKSVWATYPLDPAP